VQHSKRAAGRVTPNLAAGRRKTGSPHGCPGGRTVEDRVAPHEGPLGPLVTWRRRAADRVTPKMDGRRATARVALFFWSPPLVPPPSVRFTGVAVSR
jgi:hypothetical protein